MTDCHRSAELLPEFGCKTNESLPDIAIGRISKVDLSQWTAKVKEYYNMPICFLALEAKSSKGMYVKGRHGIETTYVPLPSICHHGDSRELPIIVADTRVYPMYRYDELVQGPPNARLYIGAPLLLPRHRCIGTLCLMDRKPRDHFSLRACGYIVESAKQIGALLHQEVEKFLCATMDSLGSLRESQPSMGSSNSSDGQSGTRDSLEELDAGEAGQQSPTPAAEGHNKRAMQSATAESLVTIPEDGDLKVEDAREDASSVSGGEESDQEGGKAASRREKPAESEQKEAPDAPTALDASVPKTQGAEVLPGPSQCLGDEGSEGAKAP